MPGVDIAPAFGEPDHEGNQITLPIELVGKLDEDEAMAMILAMVT